MRELLPRLLGDIARGQKVAICRLVETRGSTPQKAGAAMLVYADGSQVGTLGGGCVEAEVKRRALGAIDSQKVAIERFQLDADYGWDDGLICGGRMHVLIDPLAQEVTRQYYVALNHQIDEGRGAIEAIVFDAEASALPATACYLFDEAAQMIASTEGGFEDRARQELAWLLPSLQTRPRVSASRGVALLPWLSRCPLLIVGGGHVGQAVAKLASELDFVVSVVDDRHEYLTEDRFPTAKQRIAGRMSEVLPRLEITPATYCLIVTRGHNHDEEALFHLIRRGAFYIGMIGSRRKIKLIFEDLLAAGISSELLEKVHAPVGLNIGSQTVPEIAVSIAAELVAVRNQGGIQSWQAFNKIDVGE